MSSKRRNLISTRQVDYKKIHTSGKDNYTESSSSSDSNKDLNLSVDIQREKELCRSFNEEEELEYDELMQQENSDLEEGEVSCKSDGEDEQIQACINSCNIEKLKRILKKKEEANKRLKKEMEREKMKEKEEKEIQALLGQINKANKMQKELQRSIASSKASIPRNSPRVQKNGKDNKKEKIGQKDIKNAQN